MEKPLKITSGSIQAEVWNDKVIFVVDEFCIENTARKIYQRLAEIVLLNKYPEPGIQEAVELLLPFLEKEDFSAIRAADEELAGGYKVRVQIYRDDSGEVHWAKV